MKAAPPAEQITQRLSATSAGDTQLAAALLCAGKLVAMPTETVYGLAADALNAVAVAAIFAAKRRPGWDPLIVHVCHRDMLLDIVRETTPTAAALMDTFWPGPLTLLLPRRAELPASVTAGRDLVGVRMPRHPVALELIHTARLPLAAPSANLFGHVSPTTAQHVLADLDGRIDAVLDGGPCAIGVESTVLDPAAMVLYRRGGVSVEQIEQVTGLPVNVYVPPTAVAAPEGLPSPGVGIRHYAPRARLVLVTSEEEMRGVLADADASRTGILRPEGWLAEWTGPSFPWGHWDDSGTLARMLYGGLRSLDDAGVERIVSPLPSRDGGALRDAIRDRLLKAARPA